MLDDGRHVVDGGAGRRDGEARRQDGLAVGADRHADRVLDDGGDVALAAPRGTSWAPSAVREMLYRTTYRGVITWNKGGTKKASRLRPESEWLTLDAPTLRIVPEEMWVAAHARLDQTRANTFQISQDVLDRAVLDSITELLEERLFVAAVDRALEKARANQADAPPPSRP